MSLQPVALPAFKDNYIWCLSAGKRALVVDPGDASVVEHWLQAQGLTLAVILITHHHPDHTGGLAALCASHRPVVYGPDEDIAGIEHVLHGDEMLQLDAFGEAAVLAVPGHTRGHIAFYFAAEELLFCGDTLFSAGCGRLLGGTAEQLYHSLQQLSALPDDTRVCCTHEYTQANLRFAAAVEPDNPERIAREQEAAALRAREMPTLPVLLGRERLYNPFLRCDQPALVARVSRETGQALAPGLPVFTALRIWKDRF
jgi:hydroxyacylglutathione hydrolase